MKLLPVFALAFFLSGCTANIAGKLDDYNELATGTIQTNLLSGANVDIKFENSGVSCSGMSKVFYYPVSSVVAQMFLIPRCTGQKGYVMLDCSDNTSFRTQFEVTLRSV